MAPLRSGALDSDTIAAIATPSGRGGVGIVRISGPDAACVARAVTGQALPPPREAGLATFHDTDGVAIDRGLVLAFVGPASFTGEDVVELHGHGGPVVMDMLLAAALAAGARVARPGEFTERAFLNGKLDLAQAEAVADLIDGATAAAVRGAMRSLDGEFSRRIDTLVEGLRELRAYVEAAIDFPEDEVDFLEDGTVLVRLETLLAGVREVGDAARQGALLSGGATVVLAGAPNVGKSSLLNRLAGHDRAIVTEVPGTTRDVLSEVVELDGVPVRLVDTAGLRESSDPVEVEGIRRARRELDRADVVIVLSDATMLQQNPVFTVDVPEGVPVLQVCNKIDLCTNETPSGTHENAEELRVSALTGAGVPALRARLADVLGIGGRPENAITARRRHMEALARAAAELDGAVRGFRESAAGELLAEDLRRAHDHLGAITGAVTADELLGDIFGRFCIGK